MISSLESFVIQKKIVHASVTNAQSPPFTLTMTTILPSAGYLGSLTSLPTLFYHFYPGAPGVYKLISSQVVTKAELPQI